MAPGRPKPQPLSPFLPPLPPIHCPPDFPLVGFRVPDLLLILACRQHTHWHRDSLSSLLSLPALPCHPIFSIYQSFQLLLVISLYFSLFYPIIHITTTNPALTILSLSSCPSLLTNYYFTLTFLTMFDMPAFALYSIISFTLILCNATTSPYISLKPGDILCYPVLICLPHKPVLDTL